MDMISGENVFATICVDCEMIAYMTMVRDQPEKPRCLRCRAWTHLTGKSHRKDDREGVSVDKEALLERYKDEMRMCAASDAERIGPPRTPAVEGVQLQ